MNEHSCAQKKKTSGRLVHGPQFAAADLDSVRIVFMVVILLAT